MNGLELGRLRDKCLVQLLHGQRQVCKQPHNIQNPDMSKTRCAILPRVVLKKADRSLLTLRSDVGATALRRQVVLQFFYLLPVLLQLHLELLDQAVEVTTHRHKYINKYK